MERPRLTRGDVVIVAMQGDIGKVRPAIVIQSNMLSEIPSVVILPCTSDLIPDCIYRPDVPMNDATGLLRPSQVMADKIAAVSLRRVREVVGRVDDATLEQLSIATHFVTGMLDA